MTRGGKWAAGTVAALVLLRVLVVVVALDSKATSPGPRHVHRADRQHLTVLPGDVRRYHRIATRAGTPYRDFEVEYPPLTLAAIEALDGPDVRQSTVNVMWSQLVVDLLIAAVLAWGWGRRAAIAYLVLGLAFLWYPFLYLRLDLLSVLLAVLALALVRRGRRATGAVALAVACFAKLWPVVLAPRLIVDGTRRARLAAVGAFAAIGALGLAGWLAVAGTDGPEQVLTFRGADGWQIESTLGSLVHTFGQGQARMEQGAMRVGVVPDVARVGLPLLGFALVGLVWWLAARTRRDDAVVLDGLAPLAAVTATLVTATILSPQYVSWLLPFAAIAWVGGERTVGVLTAARRVPEHARPRPGEGAQPGRRLPRSRDPGPQRGPDSTLRGRDRAVGAGRAPFCDTGAGAPRPPRCPSARSDSRYRSPLRSRVRSLGPSGGLLAPRRDRRS